MVFFSFFFSNGIIAADAASDAPAAVAKFFKNNSKENKIHFVILSYLGSVLDPLFISSYFDSKSMWTKNHKKSQGKIRDDFDIEHSFTLN